MDRNPKLSDLGKILVIGKEDHMWRIKDYSKVAFSGLKNQIDFHTIPGRHNDGLMARVYHAGFMNALRYNQGARRAHEFITEEHPFYSTGWFDKPIPERKREMALTGLSWLLG
jgi:hypothetical protein